MSIFPREHYVHLGGLRSLTLSFSQEDIMSTWADCVH